jgi:hypothetical protein
VVSNEVIIGNAELKNILTVPCCTLSAQYHLFTMFAMQEAVAMTRSIRDPEEAVNKLLQEAYKRESSDNITCVVVRFLHGQGSSGYA